VQPVGRCVEAAVLYDRGCRFSFSVADGDASTCGFVEFSSKWRTRFSHLRGGSYNHAVVQNYVEESSTAGPRRTHCSNHPRHQRCAPSSPRLDRAGASSICGRTPRRQARAPAERVQVMRVLRTLLSLWSRYRALRKTHGSKAEKRKLLAEQG
jgi:hypothetical protein